jgi:dienelactone hydrolase
MYDSYIINEGFISKERGGSVTFSRGGKQATDTFPRDGRQRAATLFHGTAREHQGDLFTAKEETTTLLAGRNQGTTAPYFGLLSC